MGYLHSIEISFALFQRVRLPPVPTSDARGHRALHVGAEGPSRGDRQPAEDQLLREGRPGHEAEETSRLSHLRQRTHVGRKR